jgi:hypothetical protein
MQVRISPSRVVSREQAEKNRKKYVLLAVELSGPTERYRTSAVLQGSGILIA